MNLSRVIIIILISIIPVSAISQTVLQGGDDIGTAFPIPFLPFSDVGTTVGYTNNYQGNCSSDWGAPDIVYSFSPPYYMTVMISLCQSSNFDTRLYVFEDSPNTIIACNDDYCSNQYSNNVSSISCLQLSPGHNYYIVIDGYGAASGQYSLDINYPPPGVSISGSVHDTEGAPISGANIRILQGGNPIWNDTTDALGYYYAFGLSEGAYTVEASKIGFITQIQGPVNVLTCDPAFVDFVLERDLPPCNIIPNPSAIIEDEPICYDDFIDTFNIGCSEGIWDTIPANCIFFGTSGDYNYQDATVRDADWLEFELTDSSSVRLEGMAEFPITILILKQDPVIPCNGQAVMNYAIGLACDSFAMESNLASGKYWVWVAPSEFTGVNCGSKYQFSLTSTRLYQCDYVGGDINNSGVFNGIDITYGVGYFKGGPPPPYSCFCHGYTWYVAGDFNGDCVFNGIDIVYVIACFKSGFPYHGCSACRGSR